MTGDDLRRAAGRALRLYPRSRGHQTVYMDGARAALAGRPADACPYPRDPRKTWRAAWRRAWLRGYRSVAK